MLRVRPQPNGLLYGVGVQKGDRRVAVPTFAVVLQINRCPTLGALDLTDLCSDVFKLRGGRDSNELFLAQELMERGKSPVAARTGEV